jgi:hypothetical protein
MEIFYHKMIPKPDKPKHVGNSYRPISLEPTCEKLFEKLILKRLNLIASEEKNNTGYPVWISILLFHNSPDL